jgi:lauroyl/myristoyl acyltransferase
VIFAESPARDAYRVAIWGGWRRLIQCLPTGQDVRANLLLGNAIGRCSGGSREHIEANLQRAFPMRDDLKALSLQAFETHISHQYIPMSFKRITAETAERYLTLEGLEHLDALQAKGTGAVFMHPHMGPAQLPLCTLGALGYPMHQIGGGEVAGLSKVGQWAAGWRHRLEEDMQVTLHDGKGFLRPVIRALQSGAFVMTTCDGTGGGEELGRRVVRDVLGHPMHIPISPVFLALSAEVPLLTLSTHRNPETGPAFRTQIGPPIELNRDQPRKKALAEGSDAIASFLTDVLSSYPADWHFWDHFEPGRFLESSP